MQVSHLSYHPEMSLEFLLIFQTVALDYNLNAFFRHIEYIQQNYYVFYFFYCCFVAIVHSLLMRGRLERSTCASTWVPLQPKASVEPHRAHETCSDVTHEYFTVLLKKPRNRDIEDLPM